MKTTLCCSILVALAALSGTTQARSNYIPRTERGQLVANLVQRWSPEAAQRMKTTPEAWANAMGSAFEKTPIEKLRQAVAATRIEDVIATLQSPSFSTSSVTEGLKFHPMTPCRIADTRKSTKLAAGETRKFTANPADPAYDLGGASCGGYFGSVLALKVTAVDSEGAGLMNLFPYGEPMPAEGALNYATQVLDNHRVDVPLDQFQNFQAFTTNSTHLVIDVVGSWEPAPLGFLKCFRTAEFVGHVIDGSSSTVINAPVCESGATQTATFCRSGSKSTTLLGVKDKQCVFADATPNGVGGSAYAASKCCYVGPDPQ